MLGSAAEVQQHHFHDHPLRGGGAALYSRFGILRKGQLVAFGTLDELRTACRPPDATLDEFFTPYAGESADAATAHGDTSHARLLIGLPSEGFINAMPKSGSKPATLFSPRGLDPEIRERVLMQTSKSVLLRFPEARDPSHACHATPPQ